MTKKRSYGKQTVPRGRLGYASLRITKKRDFGKTRQTHKQTKPKKTKG